MSKSINPSFLKRSVISIALASGLAFSSASSAAFINFDTDQSGTPYAGLGSSFVANEYNGVVINDSDPSVGSTFVNLTNPVNVGTPISGYYINVGAFSGVQTELTFDFTTAVTTVDFDFANPQGFLTVNAFDVAGASLGVFNFNGPGTFVNQAGFNQGAGHVSLSGIGNIASLQIQPNFNEALIVDNLRFQPVPVPAALPLFASGLLGLGLIKRRKEV